VVAVRGRQRVGVRVGDIPIIIDERGLIVRERIFVPLWVTMLKNLLAGCWRLVVRLVRLVIRYPIPSLVLLVEAAVYRRHGWLAVLALTSAMALTLGAWRWRWPVSFTRRVVVPVRSWWRFHRVYGRRWRVVMAGCGLVEAPGEVEVMPQIARLRSYPERDELTVTLAPGQIPADVSVSCEALAHGLGAWRAGMTPDGPGRVTLHVLWRDPLTDPVHPTDNGVGVGNPDDGGKGSRGGGLRELVTPSSVMARLASVPVGVTESGTAWRLTLLPGRHLLVAGTTGSGKSGLLWGILWGLQDLIRAGWISVTALDPKYVELRAVATSGLGTVVTDVPGMPGVLEDLVAELDARCAGMTGRAHVPSPSSPIRVVIVDELATLTALSDAKPRTRVEHALGHLLSRGRAAGFLIILTSVEATKDVVRWRGLCANRVCYRTDDDQADLVLGDGAHDLGAATELIPEDLPGVAYTRTEGRAGITRVRTVHITDAHLEALHPQETASMGAGSPPPAGLGSPSTSPDRDRDRDRSVS
jgi:S-DNA-T family DNA segregation ATPase FtsK/SpoIIIE